MTAVILDGKATAAAVKADLRERVDALRERGITPGLGTVLVGDDPGSHAYVGGKHRDCAEVGIASIRVDLRAETSQEDLEAEIRRLNDDPAVTGYIVQLPLPKHLDANRVLGLMDPAKDADGLHPTNLGRLVLGEPAPLPCTPRGIVELLRRYDVAIDGAEVVVVGRGVTVGRPLGLLLTRKSENATVTLCHTGTRDLAAHLRRHAQEAKQRGVPTGHRDVVDLAHGSDAAACAAAQALLAPERRVVNGHVLGVWRHPGGCALPGPGQCRWQRRVVVQPGGRQPRRQGQQHLLGLPRGGAAGCIGHRQCDMGRLAAKLAHRLPAADHRALGPCVRCRRQRSHQPRHQCTGAADQAH